MREEGHDRRPFQEEEDREGGREEKRGGPCSWKREGLLNIVGHRMGHRMGHRRGHRREHMGRKKEHMGVVVVDVAVEGS